jgi:hypothetical protein
VGERLLAKVAAMAMVVQAEKMAQEVPELAEAPDSSGEVRKSLHQQLLTSYWYSQV